MCKIIIVAFLAVVGIVNAYDFSDELYNEILTSELQELLSGNVYGNVRVRRDDEAAKCQSKHPLSGLKSCCSNDIVDHYHEADRPIMLECRNELYGKENQSDVPRECGNVHANKDLYLCLGQCVGQKLGYIDSNGKLLPDKLRNSIKEKLSKIQWLQPELDTVINKCIGEVESANKESSEEGKCKPGASTIGHCVWREIQFACPAEEITDVENCEKIRNYLNTKPQIP